MRTINKTSILHYYPQLGIQVFMIQELENHYFIEQHDKNLSTRYLYHLISILSLINKVYIRINNLIELINKKIKNIKLAKEVKLMGSYPEGKTSTANDINCAQVQLFNRQVEKMKFENNKQIFKERSKQTKDALDIALMNLKQNKLLQTSYFKKLNKKTDKQRNDNNNRQRLKTEKANTIKKMIFMDKQASYTSQKNKSQSNLNKIQNSDRNTIKRERKSKFEPIYVITQKSNA